MARLVWDRAADKFYESGLDRGVLYLPDGSGVPWNGLTSVVEKVNKESTPVYYDGMKINDLVVLGSFTASMKAVTYPDEFIEIEGLGSEKRGVFYADQMPQAFALCYRTMVGNETEGPSAGYKLHILYNVTAIPNDKTYASIGEDPSLVEFEWEITAVPEEIPGFRPTAHIVVDSRKVDALLLIELERILYGDRAGDALLIPMLDLVTMINNFLRVEITDNGDGTWTATTSPEYESLITFGAEEYFEIAAVNAWYHDDDTYSVTSTTGGGDVPQIKIHDSGNGLWTATSDFPELIVDSGVGIVTIHNANTEPIDANSYRIEDTPPEG